MSLIKYLAYYHRYTFALIKMHKGIKTIENTKYNKHNKNVFKDILQNYYTFGIPQGLKCLKNDYNELRLKVFKFLDEQEDPYNVIYSTKYEMNTYKGKYGKYKLDNTGINENTNFIAKEYAMYKLGY